MSFTIRPAVTEDADQLAPNLRTADVKECLGWGADPHVNLRESVGAGMETLALVGREGEVLGMFGLGCRHPIWNMTTIWLMGTDTLVQDPGYRKQFWIDSKRYVNKWNWEHGNLGNMVHSENVVHIHWLVRLKFQVNTQNVITSPRGDVYYPFIRSHTCVTP